MDLLNVIDNNEYTHTQHRITWSNRECIICGSTAIGMNFGVITCAPCKGIELHSKCSFFFHTNFYLFQKAFFRRNARRKEVLKSPCHHSDTELLKGNNLDIYDKTHYLQIRHCSSCRLRRCFEVGMKEELVRTDEEKQRYRQLVDMNRRRREILRQHQQQQKPENQLLIYQRIMNNNGLLNEVDWSHLSNIIYAYDTLCLKTYLDQRANIFIHATSKKELTIEHCAVLPINLTLSLSLFLKSLPIFQSISRSKQYLLCKNNLRRLIFLNIHELNQSCFSEPWQINADKATWEFICGAELYKQFVYTEKLAEKSMIADPIVTRLWFITLFFSTPLFSYYDTKSLTNNMMKKLTFIDIQNTYITLLWKYLLHRHGYMESVRIYSNLIHVFLNMLHMEISINIRLRTQKKFMSIHETLDKLVTLDINQIK